MSRYGWLILGVWSTLKVRVSGLKGSLEPLETSKSPAWTELRERLAKGWLAELDLYESAVLDLSVVFPSEVLEEALDADFVGSGDKVAELGMVK